MPTKEELEALKKQLESLSDEERAALLAAGEDTGVTPDGDGESHDNVSDDTESPKTLEEAKAELNKIRDALSKANAEARDRRLKLKELEEAEKKRKLAELSETERLKAEKAEAEKAMKRALEAAKKAGLAAYLAENAADFQDISALRLVVLDKLGTDAYTDEGAVNETALAAELETLRKEKAWMLKKKGANKPDLDGGSGNNNSGALSEEEQKAILNKYGV